MPISIVINGGTVNIINNDGGTPAPQQIPENNPEPNKIENAIPVEEVITVEPEEITPEQQNPQLAPPPPQNQTTEQNDPVEYELEEIKPTMTEEELKQQINTPSFKNQVLETLKNKDPKKVLENLMQNKDEFKTLIKNSNLSKEEKKKIDSLIDSLDKASQGDVSAITQEITTTLVNFAAGCQINMPLAFAITSLAGFAITTLTGDRAAGESVVVGSTVGLLGGSGAVYLTAAGSLVAGPIGVGAAIVLGAASGLAYYRLKKRKQDIADQLTQNDLQSLGNAINNGIDAIPDTSLDVLRRVSQQQEEQQQQVSDTQPKQTGELKNTLAKASKKPTQEETNKQAAALIKAGAVRS